MFSSISQSTQKQKTRIIALASLLSVSLCFMGYSLAAVSKPTTLSSLLKLRKTSFTSIEANGTEINIMNKSVELRKAVREEDHRSWLNTPSQLTQFSWMARGQEQRGERLQITPLNAKQKLHLLSYTDGHKTQVWDWGSPSVQEYEGDSTTQSLSEWLQVASHGNAFSPLLDPLIAGTPQLIGTEKLGRIDTQKYEQNIGDEIQSWWVAPAFGSVVVKYERRNAIPEKRSIVSWRMITVIDKIEKADGFWMPRQARRFNLVILENGKTFWEIWTQATISEVKINAPAPSAYEIKFPLQTYFPQKSNLDLKPVGGEIGDELPRFASKEEKKDLPAVEFSEIPLSLQNAAEQPTD
jgi:hypothetical protein